MVEAGAFEVVRDTLAATNPPHLSAHEQEQILRLMEQAEAAIAVAVEEEDAPVEEPSLEVASAPVDKPKRTTPRRTAK